MISCMFGHAQFGICLVLLESWIKCRTLEINESMDLKRVLLFCDKFCFGFSFFCSVYNLIRLSSLSISVPPKDLI